MTRAAILLCLIWVAQAKWCHKAQDKWCYKCDLNNNCSQAILCDAELFCYSIYNKTSNEHQKGCCSNLANWNNWCEQLRGETFQCYTCETSKCNQYDI